MPQQTLETISDEAYQTLIEASQELDIKMQDMTNLVYDASYHKADKEKVINTMHKTVKAVKEYAALLRITLETDEG